MGQSNEARCRECGDRLPEDSSQDGLCQQCRSSSPTDSAAPNADEASTRTLEAAATRTLPDRIGPYKIRDFLGEGGMGAVYLADADLIKRGKILKPVEFGHKVFIAESGKGLIIVLQNQRFEDKAHEH